MAQESPGAPSGDPWSAFGLLVAGVGFYGVVGWLLDRWWGTSFAVVIGILFGAALGTYATWARFRLRPDDVSATQSPATPRPTSATRAEETR